MMFNAQFASQFQNMAKTMEIQEEQKKNPDLTPDQLMSYVGINIKINVGPTPGVGGGFPLGGGGGLPIKSLPLGGAGGLPGGLPGGMDLGNKIGGAMSKISDATSGGGGGLSDFAMSFLKSLIPSPTVVGDVISSQIVDKNIEESGVTLSQVAEASYSMDRTSRSRVTSKRASITAKPCKHPGCQAFHLRLSDFCAEHEPSQNFDTVFEKIKEIAISKEKDSKEKDSKEKGSKMEEKTEKSESATEKNQDTEPEMLTLWKEQAALRKEMVTLAESFKITSDITEYAAIAKSLLGENTFGLPDIELGQLYDQFLRLDVDKDGRITISDIRSLIEKIDSEWAKNNENLQKVEEYLTSSHPQGLPSMDFVNYVFALTEYRRKEALINTQGGQELLKTGFWDLRLCILLAPNKPLEGILLKRGYVLPNERLNNWYIRYVRIEDGTKLVYYTEDPSSPDAKKKGEVDLSTIAIVDFSPKTTIPPQKSLIGIDVSKEVVFKITTFDGRRYTFSAPREKAIEWCAYLYWYVESSRRTIEWRDNWGSRRKNKITLRDWMNAGAVLAKLSVEKQMAMKIQNNVMNKLIECNVIAKDGNGNLPIKSFVLTPREQYYLKVVGLDESNMAEAAGLVLTAVKCWNIAKVHLAALDQSYTHGAGQTAANGIVYAVNLYRYAAAVKNRINENKFGVQWASKGEERDCAVCHYVFKSFTLRKTLAKHHCRSCGRVVCQNCSSQRVYFEISKKMERVCDECITNNGPPSDRKVKHDLSLEGIGKNYVEDSAGNLAEEFLGEGEEEESDVSEDDDEKDEKEK